MIDLSKMEGVARKFWAKKKWEEYTAGPHSEAIIRAVKAYEQPYAEEFKENINRAKWKRTVDRKVDYLLARPPVIAIEGEQSSLYQDILDSLNSLLRATAKDYLLKGSVIWIVQGNGIDIEKRPQIVSDMIAIYGDKDKVETLAYIRPLKKLVIDATSGEEEVIEYLELYYENKATGAMERDTFCLQEAGENKGTDGHEVFAESPIFIEIGKTGDPSLYSFIESLLEAFETVMKYQDGTVSYNTKPLIEVRDYAGTAMEDIRYAVNVLGIVKTGGTGGVTIHTRNMDSQTIDLYLKRLTQEYAEATATVMKDSEMAFAVSGKALDRLFIDMENDAREMASILEEALRLYFKVIGKEDIDIVWNTDRPSDDVSIIGAIQQSRGLLSDETLIEQHPWVNDPQKEMERKKNSNLEGFEDLL